MHILLQTSYLHARDFSGFYFRLLTFIKIKFLQKKITRDHHQIVKQFGSRSGPTFWVQTVCKRLLADDKILRWHAKGYTSSVQYIIQHLRYTCNVYHKYSDTLNTFHMLCPFKQSQSNIQRIWLESVLLSNAKWDTFIPLKVFISFV